MLRFKRLWHLLHLLLCLSCAINLKAQEGERIYNTFPKQANTFYKLKSDTAVIYKLIRQSVSAAKISSDSGLLFLKMALAKSLTIGYNDGAAQAYLGLGVYAIDKGKYDDAIAFMQRALPYCQSSFFYKRQLLILYNNDMAIPYLRHGDYETAISYFLKILDELGPTDSQQLIITYNNIAAIWLSNSQYDKSLQYTLKAAEIGERKKYGAQLGDIYSNISAAYFDKRDSVKAYEYAQKTMDLCLKYPNHDNEQQAYTTIAALQQEPQKTIYYLQKALKVGKAPNVLIEIHIRLGDAYAGLGKYKQAEQSLITALKIAKESGINDAVTFYAHYSMADVYAKMGRYKDAYKQQRTYIAQNDSILSVERNTAVNQLEIKYHTTQKDKALIAKQLLITKQEVNIQRNKILIWLTSLGSLLLVITSLSLFLLYRNNRHKRLLQSKQIDILRQEQKILQLNSLMEGEERERNRIARDLHDGIGGLLSAAKMSFSHTSPGEMLPANYNNGMQLLDDAYRELRQTAHNLSPEILNHKGLIEASRIFCEKVARSKNIVISFESFGTLPLLKERESLSIYRILQELIHNAIKHAHATNILIQMSIEDACLNMTVEDNGIGINNNTTTKGIGMSNLYARVAALHGSIDIDSRLQEGTTIYLKFSILDLINEP